VKEYTIKIRQVENIQGHKKFLPMFEVLIVVNEEHVLQIGNVLFKRFTHEIQCKTMSEGVLVLYRRHQNT
jgi:hypothetical protein